MKGKSGSVGTTSEGGRSLDPDFGEIRGRPADSPQRPAGGAEGFSPTNPSDESGFA